jgi:hypothetical protein
VLQQRARHQVVADLGRDVQRRPLVGPHAGVQDAWVAAQGALDRGEVAAAHVRQERGHQDAHPGWLGELLPPLGRGTDASTTALRARVRGGHRLAAYVMFALFAK